MVTPVLIVHGGAGDIPEEDHAPSLAGCRAAFDAAWKLLEQGGSALDAVEAAVRVMEDDPVFDAGVGSVLNSVGEVELDAIIMDGRALNIGSVAAVRGIANPISLARKIMENTSHSMLVGENARRYAEQIGFRLCSQAELTVPREVTRFREWQQKKEADAKPILRGTVGAVAMDRDGNIAAGTSTGGIPFKLPGRVGDSPLVGSGAYADNETGGASATGHGEMIMRVVLSKTATDAIANGFTAQHAAERAIDLLDKRVKGEGGVIVIDPGGGVGFAHNTAHMVVAWRGRDGEICTYIRK